MPQLYYELTYKPEKAPKNKIIGENIVKCDIQKYGKGSNYRCKECNLHFKVPVYDHIKKTNMKQYINKTFFDKQIKKYNSTKCFNK
jgi:hypothetical protein